MNQQQHRLMHIIQKIDVFKRLTLMEAERLLKICHFQMYAPNQEVYRIGEPSLEMLILLQGKLKVLSDSKKELGEIEAGTATGEMGLFTGHPRSATIVSVGKSGGLVLKKRNLNILMEVDREICLKVLQNVVNMLSDRLANANRKMIAQDQMIQQLQNEVDVLSGKTEG